MQAVLPGKTIGIVGGGQLGRMTALFAKRMGYTVHVLDPADDSPAAQVADRHVRAKYDDLAAARALASGVDVVTFEFENIPAATLEAMERCAPVRPSPHVLDTCRHRLREKDFLRKAGFPVADYRAIDSPAALETALAQLGGSAILKTADFGYDGKGQSRVESGEGAEAAFQAMGRPLGVAERIIPFEKEVSVICARGADGATACFPIAENIHANHILDITLAPARISAATGREAVEIGAGIAQALDVVGLIAVELFVLPGGGILVNELAPRPHNSGHFTFEACITSQFEQHVRAVCGLPLGNPSAIAPAAMANLLGDLWKSGEPNWAGALSHPRAKLHLYGKSKAVPGRKMGHITALANDVESARGIVTAARDALAVR